MAFEEQIEQYKSKKLSLRLVLSAIPGLLIGGYLFFDASSTLESEVQQARSRRDVAKSNIVKSQKKKNDLPKVETELEKIRAQLTDVKRILPTELMIDNILRRTAIFAGELGVDIDFFRPSYSHTDVKGEKFGYRIVELTLKGKYHKVTKLYDHLLHLPSLIHLRKIRYQSVRAKTSERIGKQAAESERIEEHKKLALVESKAEMLLFRGVN